MNRKIVNFLLGFITFLIVYNTLIPFTFDYGLSDLPGQIAHINWLPGTEGTGRVSLTDLAGNILLFVPFGFLMYLFLRQRNYVRPLLKVVLLGALLSLTIEFFQLFIAARNTALHDLFNNTLGTLIGGIAALIFAERVVDVVEDVFYFLFREQPFSLIIVAMVALQLFAAVMPLTVSITVSDLVKSIKSTNLVPFDYHSIGAMRGFPDAQDALPFDITPMIEDILFWAAVAFVMMICHRLYWAKGRLSSKLIYLFPILFFPAVEFGQLFITKRTSDINDVLSGLLGFALGYLIFAVRNPFQKLPLKEDPRLLKTPLLIYTIFILFSGFRPFDWSLDPQVINMDLTADSLIPFYAYFRHTSLWNLFDMGNSLSFIFPISLYITYHKRKQGIEFDAIYVLTTLLGLGMGLVIEGVQLFSFERIAEITDVIFYAAGGALGTFTWYYYEKELVKKIASQTEHPRVPAWLKTILAG